MTLDEKLLYAKSVIRRTLRSYQNPVVMSSFGKDSMLVLWLLKEMGHKLPILFHREPFMPKKYEFANEIIQEENFTVYDYPPIETQMAEKDGHYEVINLYQIRSARVYLPTGLRSPVNYRKDPYLCTLNDLLMKPTGTFNFPWDVGFAGSKSSDIDPIQGKMTLSCDIIHNEQGCDYAFPLRHLTDEDVWIFSQKFCVPFNDKRYDRLNAFRELIDISHNPDYFPACWNCVDKEKADTVFCPLVNKAIPNISSSIKYYDQPLPAYIGEK